MCEPGTLAALTFAAQAGSSVMGYMAESANAKAQNAQNQAMRNLWEQEASLEKMDMERQRMQERDAAAAEANAYAREALRERGALDAILGEGGAGNSATRRLSSIGIKQGEDMATIQSNATKVQSELGFQASARSNAKNQKMASLKDASKPSLLGTALQIGGAGLQYGNNMNRIKGKPTF